MGTEMEKNFRDELVALVSGRDDDNSNTTLRITYALISK